MNKKRYKIYKMGGQQGQVINPMAQFLAKAETGMEMSAGEEMPTEEEMAMMQQERPMMSDLMSEIQESLDNNIELEDIVIEKINDGVSADSLQEVFIELGVPESAIKEAFDYAVQMLQPQEQQPSEEELMAMQQQQMPEEEMPAEQPPMGRAGYIKQRLKEAQEGMSVEQSNLNLAAEDNVNNVSNLLKFTQENKMANEFGNEYDEMMMMPEARLGREARRERREDRREDRMERREARRDARDERQAVRQAGRANRQAQRAYRQAYRNIATPFGYNPPMIGAGMGIGADPMVMGNISFEGERGLFGRLKNYKINIDNLGFPVNYTRGLYRQGLMNPGYVQQDYIRKQLPGEVINYDPTQSTKTVNPNTNEIPDKESVKGTEKEIEDTDKKKVVEQKKNIKRVESKDPSELGDSELVETKDGTKILVKNKDGKDDIGWSNTLKMAAGIGITSVVILGTVVGIRKYRKWKKQGLADADIAKKAEQEGAEKLSEKTVTKTSKVKDWLKSRPQTKDPLTGKFQKKATTVPKYVSQSTQNLAKKTYKPVRNIIRKTPTFGRNVLRVLSRGKIKEEGGVVDYMDMPYSEDLYRFTGGGAYDYFDGGMVDPGYEDVTDPYMPYMEHGGPHDDQIKVVRERIIGPGSGRFHRSDAMPYFRDETGMPTFTLKGKLAARKAFEEGDVSRVGDAGYRGPYDEMMHDVVYAGADNADAAFAAAEKYRGPDDDYLNPRPFYPTMFMSPLSARNPVDPYDQQLQDWSIRTLEERKQDNPVQDKVLYDEFAEYEKDVIDGMNDPSGIFDPETGERIGEKTYDWNTGTWMQYGGMPMAKDSLPMAFPGYTVTNLKNTPGKIDKKSQSKETRKTFVPGNVGSGNVSRKDFFNTMSPEQKRMMIELDKQRRGSRGYGYGDEYARRVNTQSRLGMVPQTQGMFLSSPYGGGNRRGVLNTLTGYNRPAVFNRAGQWLSPWQGASYASGLPALQGIPAGANLQEIDIVKRGLFERMFPGKDAQGNRQARGPKKSIKYTFNVPGSTTPGLTTGDDKISNFQMSTTNRPNFNTQDTKIEDVTYDDMDQKYDPNVQDPTYQQQIEGDGSEYDAMIMNNAANRANQEDQAEGTPKKRWRDKTKAERRGWTETAPGKFIDRRGNLRSAEGRRRMKGTEGMTETAPGKFIDDEGALVSYRGSAPTTMSADPGWKDYGTEGFEYNPGFDPSTFKETKSKFDEGNLSKRQLRKMGFKRKERQAYEEDPGIATSMRRERMRAKEKQYGGFQEGEVYNLTAAEIGAIMAAGGEVEFL